MLTVLQIFVETPYFRRIVAAVALLAVIHGVGTVGFRWIGGPGTSAMDAFYMTFITVATIGYGEVVDLHGATGARLFTMAVATAGIGTLWFIFSSIAVFMIETNLNRAYRSRRMHADLLQLHDHLIVCGAGRVGSYVIDDLRAGALPFVVIEADADRIATLGERDPSLRLLHGDGADDDLLAKAGVERARGVFAVTGDDALNLMITLSAKQLNPAVRVVARVHDARNANKARRVGADEIVSPDYSGGRRIAGLMTRPHVVSAMDQLMPGAGPFTFFECRVGPRPLAADVGALGRSRDWLVVAVREGEQWHFHPADDVTLRPGSVLVAVADEAGRRGLARQLDAS